MKKKACGLLAIFLLISHGGGMELLAAARAKKKIQMATPPVGGVATAAPAPEILGVTWDGGQLKIALNQLVPFKTFLLQDPPRLVVELSGIPNKSVPPDQQVSGPIVQQVHTSEQGQGPSAASRIVLDLSEPADFEAHPSGTDILVTLKPNPVSKSTLKSSQGKPDLLGNLPNDPIDLDFEGEDIRNALRLLAELSGINIIYASDVGGPFTLHLKQVPFNQAFQTVLSMNSLVARQLGDNILWIMTPASLTLNRNNAQLATRTFVLNYAKADQVKTNLDLIRSTAGRKGITATDPRTNTLTIMDTPEGLDEAERLISVFDKKPIQVLIEARIVEVALDNSLDLGIQWSLSYGNSGGYNTNYGIGTSQLNTTPANSLNRPSGVSNGIVTGSPGPFVSPAAIGGASPATGVSLPAAATAGAISFGLVNNTAALLASLNVMAQKNKSRILSAPKIVTLNSEDAKIEASQQIPFPVTSVTGTGISQQSFQFVSAGIILTVNPTVNPKGQVTLKINPVVSFPVAGLTTVGPSIKNRSAQTTVIVDDGQTVVVGGLIDESDTKNIQKVPFLGDIPVLGAFFRRRFTEKKRTELLVFVTPRIIKD